MYLNWNTFYIIAGIIIHGTVIADESNLNFCNNKICSCNNSTDQESGLQNQEISCKSKNFNEHFFDEINFTTNLVKLDLDDNSITFIPNLKDNKLKVLILSRNKIEKLYDHNFKNSPELEELDLSWNNIYVISHNTFDQLKKLTKLNLSHNNLKRMNNLIFSYLPKLQQLDLSWNQNINETNDLQTNDFFEFFGVTPNLDVLSFNGCNLKRLYLSQGTNLKYLYITNNHMHQMPELPRNIKFIDFSGNPIESLNQTFVSHLFQLHVLYINDMPNLESINEYAFFGLPALKELYLQNCKKLQHFDKHAFGETVIRNETDTILEKLNVRGSSITTLSESLKYAFENLKELNIDGAPINCNCELKWLKEENFTIIGKCFEPESLHMQDISTIDSDDFECDWPENVKHMFNGLITVGILMVCITLISIVVLGLRRKRSNRRHMGSGSPYARVTIEPTCENRF